MSTVTFSSAGLNRKIKRIVSGKNKTIHLIKQYRDLETGATVYELADKGRAYLIENKLVS